MGGGGKEERGEDKGWERMWNGEKKRWRRGGGAVGREDGKRAGEAPSQQRGPVQAVGCTGRGELSPPASLASLPPQTTLDHVQTQPSQSHLPRGLSPLEPVKTVSQCQQVTWPRLDLTRFVQSVETCWLLRSNSITTRVPSSTIPSRENHGISNSFFFCNSIVSNKS